MAKRRRNKKIRKILFWVVFLVLFVVAGVIIYFVWDEYFKTDEGDKENKEEIVEVVENNNEFGKGGEGEEDPDKKVILYEGNDPNEAEGLTGVVTYAGVNGDNLMIRVNIDQYLNSGSCNLSLLINGASVYNDTAGIIDSAATSTCEGFNVPVSGLGAGNYQIVIKINSGDKSGTIRGEVNI